MRYIRLVLLLLPLFFFVGLVPVQACTSGPIYGLWFYQHVDDVTIVSFDHVHTDVTNETFGLTHTTAATQRCTMLLAQMGLQLQYLVRYRQDPLAGWFAWCYTDSVHYVQFSGAQFGQAIIDAAVARAKVIVYGCKRKAG